MHVYIHTLLYLFSADKKFRYKDNLYHEDCFTCVDCKKPMGDQSFYQKNDGYQCAKCHGDKPDDVCQKCDKVRPLCYKLGENIVHISRCI